MTTATTETTIELTPIQIAEQFVKENTSSDIAKRLADLEQKYKWANDALGQTRSQLRNYENTIEEFIKEHITEDSVDVDDLRELAAELDIELTKEVEISFTVTYTAKATVPLDFDDDIDESDFSVRIEYEGNSDYEVEETNCDIEDFDIADDNR